MAKRALIFEESDALVAALELGLLTREVMAKSVEFQSLERGALAVAPGRSIEKKTWKALAKLGVTERKLDGDWRKAPCWPALISAEPGASDEKPRAALFVLPDAQSTLGVVAELLRLGCDRASYATIEGSGDGGVIVRAYEPPYYTVVRGAGPGAPFVPYVPIATGRDDVWIEFGFDHRLASAIRVEGNERVLISGNGSWQAVEISEWTDILELADIEVLGAKRSISGVPLEEKLKVPLTLRDASRNQSPTLWVLDEDGDAQVEALISSVPDDVVSRLLFAVGESASGKRVVVLRARPGKGAPPQIALRGTAFASHAGIGNLFVPIGSAVEPPLRRDSLREHLAPDPTEVVWLVKDGASFGLDKLAERAFAPLSDWVEYTLARADDVLASWVGAVAFDTDAFVSIGKEWAAARLEKKSREPREPKHREEREPRRRRSEAAEEPRAPITVEKPSLAALPTLEKGDRSTEVLLAEIERQFLDDDAPVDSPSRAEKWQLMARLHSEMGSHRDASLCLLRWLWEAPESDLAGLSSAWLMVSGVDSSLDELLALTQPTLEQVRALVAQLIGLVSAGVEIPIDLGELNQFLDTHDVDLDVRSIWLGRLALSRSVGGDKLALARARDRILRRIRGGLALDRDVPTFLRFLGAGGDSATVNQLVRSLTSLQEFIQKATRSRSPVEAPVELTFAYVGFEFAYALARLGQVERAKSLRDQATAAIEARDPVHSFLVGAYAARIEQAIEGKPPASPLPPSVSASLNELPKFERYKVDRLRQASTVLEPQERLDPVSAFQRGESDPRGEEFAALRGMEDPGQLSIEVRKLMVVASDSGTSLDDRARLYDGLMDFFPLLAESDAPPLLSEIVGNISDIGPKRRALLFEEALMLAGFFGREGMASAIATQLDDVLDELSESDVIELAAEFGTCLRSLRRVGLASRAAALLERLSAKIEGNGTDVMLARLQVAGGRAYLGEFDSIADTLTAAQAAIEQGGLVAAERLRLIAGLARAWTFAPTDQAVAGLGELAKQITSISDSYNTNSHFCLSVIAFVDAIVLGFAGGELAMGDLGRRWLDEDEYLVRRRIHSDLEKA